MAVEIREVRETDNFEGIYQLLNETLRRKHGNEMVSFGTLPVQLKADYCGSDALDKGYIAIDDQKTVAFMGVMPLTLSHNGYLNPAYLPEYEHLLPELLEKCLSFIKERGGDRAYYFASVKFGQVRNGEIALWERMGFRSDEYSIITTMLNLRAWKVPEDLDVTGIEPAEEMNYGNIVRMMLEDGEDEMAELLQRQYTDPRRVRNQVILTLIDKITNKIAGIAYYGVSLANKGSDNEFFEASGFGIYIRPEYRLAQR